MKTRALVVGACLMASLSLSGCDRIKGLIGGKPKGQVVATVNGDEITALELRQELGNFSSRDPTVMKAAQQRALEGLILKHLMLQKAKDQKLDKSPDYIQQSRRGQESLLVQLYQRKLVQSVAAPSRAEAEAFVSSNPDRFANRRILVTEQVVGPVSPKITPAKVQPLKTLDEVTALYAAEGLQTQRNVTTIDSLQLPPQALAQISRLGADEVFVLPQGNGLVFNRIVDVRPAPFTGDAAIGYAMNAIRSQKARELVARQVELMRKTAESKITYNEAYKPAPPAKSPATKAGAPPAAAPPARTP